MRRSIPLIMVAVMLLSLGASVAGAQEGNEPTVTLTGVQIDIDSGETNTVSARYTFSVESTGSGDQELTAFTGKYWVFPDREVEDISATVDGDSVEPEVEDNGGYVTVSVPADVSDGDTVTIDLEYEVSGPEGKLKAPLWVPDYPTTGNDQVIQIEVSLPEGQHIQGDTMPKVDEVRMDGDSRTIVYNQLHVPSFVSIDYGQEAPLLTTGQIWSLLSILIIIGVMGGWVAITQGYIGSGGKTDGA